ncbi:disease resistance protein (TIR-NBS-LRR class) [Medicago truncatula]|uniref:Disease resistance protein (TIR-NBS-LRR class) n=1 Tax=Medicago truncatula TaxID=3880 RepID=A0A072TEZ0_MEDTR|nr:disease resistance protein (TIR-NBS-LRR class) [Medicago truncatula]
MRGFMLSEMLRFNEEIISQSLLKAIGWSRISIVVLSINYANSRWCMFELEKIMEIGRTGGMVVVPVFYEVDPSEVRHQEGQFGKALEDLMSTISIDESTKSNWKRELNIGGIAGPFYLKVCSDTRSIFIVKVIP